MRITLLVIHAGLLVAWSRKVTNNKTEANQMSAVNVEVDLKMGITLDMSPNFSINLETYAKVEDHTENYINPVTVYSITANDDQPYLQNLGSSTKKKRRHKKKKEKKEKTTPTTSKYSDYDNDTRYIYFPGDGDYKIHKINVIPSIDLVSVTKRKVTYWLYTRQNPTYGQMLNIKDVNSVVESNLDVRKVTVFLCHGYLGHRNTASNILLTEAFLYNSDVNVIRVDWSYYASSLWYPTSSGYAPEIGRMLGKFICWLNRSFRLPLDKVHLVGFSLGAHVMGNAGRELHGKVQRLTGLDPAGPGWWGDPASLDKTDARYVEVIHTNGGYLSFGYWDPLGHSDHYPNGGALQPNCTELPISRHICSHYRAYELMAATLKLSHLHANKCASLKHVSLNTCNAGKLQPMGNADINKKQCGIFRVDTDGTYPYMKK